MAEPEFHWSEYFIFPICCRHWMRVTVLKTLLCFIQQEYNWPCRQHLELSSCLLVMHHVLFKFNYWAVVSIVNTTGHGCCPLAANKMTWLKAILPILLQLSIYRKFEETESLLDQLRIQDDSSEQVWRGGGGLASNVSTPRRHLQTFSTAPHPQADLGTASKRPKDDKVSVLRLLLFFDLLTQSVSTFLWILDHNNCDLGSSQLRGLWAQMYRTAQILVPVWSWIHLC